MEKIEKEHIFNDHLLVSFDLKSLFTNVPLDKEVKTFLNRIYHKNEILIHVTKSETKELLKLYTKNVHFTFDCFFQNDGTAMGLPLGPVLVNIFMIELKSSVTSTLMVKMSWWTKYVNDSLFYVKKDSIEHVLKMLNGFLKEVNI